MQIERQVTIYALCEPDTNEVRYIGQTCRPNTRLYFHIVECRRLPSLRKSQWVNKLVAQGTPPVFTTLCIVDADIADETEITEIQKAKDAGLNLLNRRTMAIGGVAKQRKQHSKANVIATAIDRMYQQEATTVTTINKVTVNNPTRTRKWGWGWTNSPTGRDAYSIEIPTSPHHTGTFKQIQEAIATDKTYASMKSGGTFTNTSWFYDGKRITNRQEFNDWLQFTDNTEPVSLELE